MSTDGAGSPPLRGVASTALWEAGCKDCARDQRDTIQGARGAKGDGRGQGSDQFEYSAEWASRALDRGGNRSDRCTRHRRIHRDLVRSIAVPYVDLQTIGHVVDPSNPTGPLGGLGPLPTNHTRTSEEVDLQQFEFGLTDADILTLLHALELKRVAVLEAGTGTGKSTFGPFRLANPPEGAALHLTSAGPIVVTEPRVPAATRCAAYVGETLHLGHDPRHCTDHIGPGFAVGFQTQGNKTWDDACRLIYVTDGTMINWIRDGRLAHIGAVIVDEAHERSENIDLTLTLLRDQLPRHPHLRVIITSATIDPSFFIAYFGGPGLVHHQVVEPTKQVGYGIPLFPTIDFTDDMLANGMDDGEGGRFQGFDQTLTITGGQTVRQHAKELLNLRPDAGIQQAAWKEQMPEAVAGQAMRLLEGTEDGDILCFLPTSDLIGRAVAKIEKASRGMRNVKIYPLLASTEESIKVKALAASLPGQRKVVVSSNLAETSLTVKGIRYIIDSGLICQSEWDPEIAEVSRPTKPHSRAGIRQRWGRVGRDAPGFVFPLYTLEQFHDLPGNTPPGSTRTNLEQFLVKLKASGVDDVTQVELPASFNGVGWEPDAATQALAASFDKEVTRAQASLLKSGAVDRDGHLTSLGHELGRANGPAEQAIALMFADQLACVHEVVLSLAALQTSLVGPAALFLFDTQWPAAMRLQACRCHRGLAAGCMDDLDLILRVFNGWYASRDRERWARDRWLNQNVLLELLDAVSEQVDQLSPGMRTDADRAPDPRLAGRARAVIGRAYALHSYRPAGRGAPRGLGWVKAHGTDSDIVTNDRYTLTDPVGDVVALRRFRVVGDDPDDGAVVISGRVSVPEWAVEGDPDAFTLLERAASRAPLREAGPVEATFKWLIEHVPVGAVLSPQQGLTALLGPTPYPGELPDLEADDEVELASTRFTTSTLDSDAKQPPRPTQARRRKRVKTDSDREANAQLPGIRVPQGDIPEEEISDAATNPDLPEEPDGRADPAPELGIASAAASFAHCVFEWRDASNNLVDVPPSTVGRVLGYGILPADAATGGEAQVLVQCEALDDIEFVPLNDDDLEWGTDLDLRVEGFAHDYLDQFRVLRAANGRVLYVHPRTRGLGGFDVGLPSLLETGSLVTWTVVPGRRRRDVSSVSPVPALRRSVDAARKQAPGGWLPALLDPDSAAESGTVYLKVHDLALTSTAMVVRPRSLRALTVEDGVQEVEVLLIADDFPTLRLDRVRADNRTLIRLAEEHRDFVRRDGDRLRVTGKVLPPRTVNALLDLDAARDWSRRVWQFWLDSHQMSVSQIRLKGSQVTIPKPAWVTAKSASAAQQFARRYDVKCTVGHTFVQLTGAPNQVGAAAAALTSMVASHITVPSTRKGLVIGKGGSNLSELRAVDGLIYVDLEENNLSIVGTSRNSVAAAISRVRSLTDVTEGALTLSHPDYIRRFIGRQGSMLETLLQQSGCTRARQQGSQPFFAITGPSSAAMSAFLFAVRTNVDASAQMTVTESRADIIDTATGRSWTSEAPETPTEPTAPRPDQLQEPQSRIVATQATPVAPSKSVQEPLRPKPITVTGRTVGEALAIGLVQLHLREDQVQLQVVEQPEYTLFLGRLKRPAKVILIPRD